MTRTFFWFSKNLLYVWRISSQKSGRQFWAYISKKWKFSPALITNREAGSLMACMSFISISMLLIASHTIPHSECVHRALCFLLFYFSLCFHCCCLRPLIYIIISICISGIVQLVAFCYSFFILLMCCTFILLAYLDCISVF